MNGKYNRLLAKVYADLFDYPLTEKEAVLWAINPEGLPESTKNFSEERRAKLMRVRKTREKISQEKFKRARDYAKNLAGIFTIEGVFLTGSVAVGNAGKSADIDLMILTKPGTLWATRFWVFVFLRSLRLLRSLKNHNNKICPNIFLDTNHLEIKEKNLYTAHEVLQAKCLFDRGGVEKKWLAENRWTGEYLPKAYEYKTNQANKPIPNTPISTNTPISNLDIGNWVLKNWTLGFGLIELCAFVGQYFFMKRKITNERVGWGYAFFHPNQLGKEVEDKFLKRLVKYTDQ